MKIKLGKYIVTIFEVQKLQKANLEFDAAAAKKQADEIKNTQQFAELKKRAAALRATR